MTKHLPLLLLLASALPSAAQTPGFQILCVSHKFLLDTGQGLL